MSDCFEKASNLLFTPEVEKSTKKVIDNKEEIRRIVYLTLRAVGENATDCKIDGVMKYIEENM